MTPILNSVHTSNDSLQRRGVSLSVVTSIKRDYSEQGDMTKLTQMLNSVHTYKDSLQRRREPLSVYTKIESDVTSKVK
jgi:hypothetical protein